MAKLNQIFLNTTKTTIVLKIFILTLVMLAGIIFIINAISKNNKNILTATQLVLHTEQVISQAENLLSLSKDIETASRGYVITSDSSFLEPLFSAEKTLFSSIHRLKELTSDNASQQNRVHLLENYIKKRLQLAIHSIDVKNNSGLSSAIEFTSGKSGKRYTDKIRQVVLKIQGEEKLLLKIRQESYNSSIRSLDSLKHMMLVLISVLLLMFLIAVGLALFEKKEKAKRAEELKITNKELHFQEDQKIIQEEANKELEAFSYSVSHDLRAPLRHISGYVDLLLKNNKSQLDESGQRYLSTISESSKEMGNLIDALLSFSRLSRSEILKTEINTRNMIDRILKSFQNEIEKRAIKIVIHYLPDCLGNENLMNQVWLNLISNAVKYTRHQKNAIIEIGAENSSTETIYFIKDNGAGFDMKYANKLFGVFQRLHKTSEFEGIGIGLANINRIVVRHKGTCRAEGKVGFGATFYFSLPKLTKI